MSTGTPEGQRPVLGVPAESNAQEPPEWFQESIELYTNPLAFARGEKVEEVPELVEEKVIKSQDDKRIKFQVHLLKERLFWSKVSLHWIFQPADLEGNNATKTIISLVFDTWTGELGIFENAVQKAKEVQRPIVGGGWRARTHFGELEIKIETFWTGYQYELWFEGEKIYSLFT
ncbi:unnamed protein product [Discosporangium mesarthrocarpum]